MENDDLARLIEEAARLAAKAPKHLQEAAFNQAFQALQGGPRADSGKGNRKVDKLRAAKNRPEAPDDEAPAIAVVDRFVREVSRTDHTEVGTSERLADRALLVLHIAHEELGVDGLSPAEIAQILSKKFRLPAKTNSVAKALVRETASVDDQNGRFHIMHAGEERVSILRDPASTTSPAQKVGQRKARPKGRADHPMSEPATSKKAPKARKEAKALGGRSNGKGPKAAILDAVASGYFDQARSATDLQDHLRKKKGYHFGGMQIRLALLRLVREETLDRDENKDGQYEYSKS